LPRVIDEESTSDNQRTMMIATDTVNPQVNQPAAPLRPWETDNDPAPTLALPQDDNDVAPTMALPSGSDGMYGERVPRFGPPAGFVAAGQGTQKMPPAAALAFMQGGRSPLTAPLGGHPQQPALGPGSPPQSSSGVAVGAMPPSGMSPAAMTPPGVMQAGLGPSGLTPAAMAPVAPVANGAGSPGHAAPASMVADGSSAGTLKLAVMAILALVITAGLTFAILKMKGL
jgi:hypothetical protein